MRRPLGVSVAGWFLALCGASPVLLLLVPATPTGSQAAALAAFLPSPGWFEDAVRWADVAMEFAAGVLVLRGVRAGRVLCAAWGATLLALAAWTVASRLGVAQDTAQLGFVIGGALADLAVCLAVAFLLLRRPARDWFALPPGERSFPVWSVRGVLGAALLVCGGLVLYGWLFMLLICVALSTDGGPKPFMVVILVVWFIPVATLLGLGLAVAPGRRGRRRLAVVGLCSGLFALFVGVTIGAALCSSRVLSLLPSGQVTAGFGPGLLLACPVLLVLLVPCVIHLRRSPAARVAVPG